MITVTLTPYDAAMLLDILQSFCSCVSAEEDAAAHALTAAIERQTKTTSA